MSGQKRVLITCVGSGVGQSAVDSLRALKPEYFLVGSDRNRFCYSVPDCDDFVPLPAIDDDSYIDALMDACASMRIDALIPGHDMELALVARNRDRFESIGTRPIVANERLVGVLRDKRAWSVEFARKTRHVVQAWTPAEFLRAAAAEGRGLPAIAKPVGGSASSGLRILRSVADAEGLGDDYVIQPFLFPAGDDPESPAIRAAVAAGRIMQASEISVQLAYGRDGALLGRFASRNRLKAGVPVEFHPVDTAELWAAVDDVHAVLESYSPSGPINLQGRVTDQGVVFFEMNPRFTGITGNRALFGFNEVALLVDNFTCGVRRRLRTNPRKVGVRQVACRAWPAERFRFAREIDGRPGPVTIVVLGATSWLARTFIAARASRGDSIVAVGRERSLDAITQAHAGQAGVDVVGQEARDLPDCMAAADVVVNCLSGRPPHGNREIVDAHLRQARLLDLAETSGVPFIVNVSSQSVYGAGRDRNETADIDAQDAYSFSKVSIEEAMRGVARRNPAVATVSLRLGRLFGPAAGLRLDEFPHRVIENAVRDLEVVVRQPDTALDLLDIRDAAGALEFFVDHLDPRWRGDVFNVGSGRVTSVGEYVASVDRACRARLGRPLRSSIREAGGDARPALATDKLSGAGWTALIPLEQSISELVGFVADAS